MAKASYSPLNQWRGRAGGQVYRVRNGEQIVSAYQPAVANPKSDAQMLQRAKFNLMTKLNAIFDARLLNGYSSSKGIARAKFSKRLMSKIYSQQLASVGERKYRANIPAEEIIFGPSAENYIKEGETVAGHLTLTDGGGKITIAIATLENLFDVDATTARVRIVDVYGDSNFTYSEVMVNDINGAIIANVPAAIEFEGLGMHRIYLQVLAPNNSTLNDFHGGPVITDDDNIDGVAAESAASYATAFNVGGSVFVGSLDIN